MPKNTRQWGLLLLFIAIAQGAGLLGTFFTVEAVSGWYQTLSQPSFAPPNWVFGPVWTFLYTLMGIAIYRVWQKRGVSPKKAIARSRGIKTYFLQLAVNASWSIVFFGMKNIGGALVIIIALLVLIVATMRHFFKVDAYAGWLFIPYLVWVSFATLLNAYIYLLN